VPPKFLVAYVVSLTKLVNRIDNPLAQTVAVEFDMVRARELERFSETMLQMIDILKATTIVTGVSEEKLKNATRGRRRHIRARQMAMYLMRTLTDHSLPRIAKIFGRDHTTVYWGYRVVNIAIKEGIYLGSHNGETSKIVEAITIEANKQMGERLARADLLRAGLVKKVDTEAQPTI
jgi:chromosomal replication initiation ATPase DnaA